MTIKSINIINGKNKWSDTKKKLVHMVLDLGPYEEKPSNKIDGFYDRLKKYLPSLKSHRCSEGKENGFFYRVKKGTWMGHIIEHIALELQTLAGYNTGWGRTRGVKGKKGVYNIVFNYEDEEKGKLAAKEALNVVNDIINDKDPNIDKIVNKLKSKSLKETIKRILREEIDEARLSDILRVTGNKNDLHNYIEKEISKDFEIDRELPTQLTLKKRYNNRDKIKVYFNWYDTLEHSLKRRIKERTNFKSVSEFSDVLKDAINSILPDELGVTISENGRYAINLTENNLTVVFLINLDNFENKKIDINVITVLPKNQIDKKNIINFFVY